MRATGFVAMGQGRKWNAAPVPRMKLESHASRSYAVQVTAAILLAMQIASIAVMAQAPIFQTAVSTASGILSCIDAFLIGALLYMSHRHSMQPSTLLSIYLPVTILFDAAKARSCFTRYDLDVSGSLLATVAALKFVLLVLEEVPKRTLFYNSGYVGKEAISGFWNRSVFWWLNTTLITGYRSLLVVDTLEELDPKFDSVVLLSRLDQVWKPSKMPPPPRPPWLMPLSQWG